MWLWRENKIHADSSLETHCNEESNRIPWISRGDMKDNTILFLMLLMSAVGAGVFVLIFRTPEAVKQIRFSIVSVPVSRLNPNASSSPVFNIIYQAQKALENSREICIHRISTTISYHGIKIARADIDKSWCYWVENYWNKYVIPVPMLATVPRYLQKQLWEEREVTMLDLEMVFRHGGWPNYHVCCNNVMLGAIDTPIPCNVTM